VAASATDDSTERIGVTQRTASQKVFDKKKKKK
jgi:hypothetical protein